MPKFLFAVSLTITAILLTACSASPTNNPQSNTSTSLQSSNSQVSFTVLGDEAKDQRGTNLYYVLIGDDGKTGTKIGCEDSLVAFPKDLSLPPADLQDRLKILYQELLFDKEPNVGDSGLYNALYQSTLQVNEVTLKEGALKAELTGELKLGGTCDTPRIQAQLEAVGKQFPEVKTIEILVNEKPLATLLNTAG